MRRLLIPVLFLSACDLATDAGGGAVGATADAGPADLTPPDADCPAYDGSGMVCLGSFEVRNFADIDTIASCAHITGDLELGANGLIEIALPLLERVDGNVSIAASTSLQRISLPELKEIGGQLSDPGATALLTELAVPRLRTVTGDIFVSGANSLSSLSLDCLDSAASLQAFGMIVTAPRLTAVPGSVVAGLQAPLLGVIGGTLQVEQGTDLPALYRVTDLVIDVTDAVNLPALRNVVQVATLGCTASPTATTLDLPVLERAGAMQICPWPALTSIQLPALRRIAGPARLGGLHIAAGGSVSAVDLPLLDFLAGDASFDVAVSVPVLPAIAGVLTVGAPLDAPVLASTAGLVLNAPLSAPALATVSGDLTANQSIDLPALASVAGKMQLFVQSGTLVFPALTTIGGKLDASGTTAIELRAPALSTMGGYLVIYGNLALANIDFPSLTSLGTLLKISQNPQLPTCQALALRDQLLAAGWSGSVKIGNNGSGTCP